MYEVMGLKDYGTWLRKGKKCCCNDSLALDLAKKGYLKVIKYHLNKVGEWHVHSSQEKLLELKKAIDLKVEAYEDFIKNEGEEDE